MSPTHTRRHGWLYRYYVCAKSVKNGAETCPVQSVAAAEIEGVVLGQVRRLLQTPEVAARTVAAYQDLRDDSGDAATREREVLNSLGRPEEVWDELFPAEQTRILRLLVERIDVAPDGIDVRLRTSGLHSLIGELVSNRAHESGASVAALTEGAAA